MITDLFKIRHDEPKSVKILRRTVIIIATGLSITAFAVLCIEVRDELPSVNIRYKTSNSLPTPGNYNCSDYINKTVYDTSQSKYLALFSSRYDITSRSRYTLSINITDPRYNISNQNDYMEMYAYDGEYDLLMNPLIYQQIQFEESLYLKNAYFFGQPRNDIAVCIHVFNPFEEHAIIPDILSYFGRQTYIDIPYLESYMSFVMTANSNSSYYAILRFIVSPPFIIIEETEERSKTILSSLGIIGGIWSFVVALYILLFGSGSVSPWGLVQKSKLFKNKYEKYIMPFTYESDTTEDFNSSIQRRLNNIEKRIQFYDKFIIDNPLLNFDNKDENPTKSI
ncbi:8578_t:CDS:2 [Scutellospora calospora]|uniref:8578_t:CDS:1 n=1 Tax=Scutellospora calospora TaxID=85575 RepID=A0ACA9M753_9GLOM|nr:8578_t:CDS:2 [Scutellospora calospora]